MRRTLRRALSCSILVAATAFAGAAAAKVPPTLTHQGRLFDAKGAPAIGNVDIQFAIYTTPSGGTSVWSEVIATTLDDGYFSVELGALSPLSAALLANDTLYLGITVGNDSEMTPRSLIRSVP